MFDYMLSRLKKFVILSNILSGRSHLVLYTLICSIFLVSLKIRLTHAILWLYLIYIHNSKYHKYFFDCKNLVFNQLEVVYYSFHLKSYWIQFHHQIQQVSYLILKLRFKRVSLMNSHYCIQQLKVC